jgi:hypothetical protein
VLKDFVDKTGINNRGRWEMYKQLSFLNFEEKTPHGRPGCKWRDKGKTILKKIRMGDSGLDSFGLR